MKIWCVEHRREINMFKEFVAAVNKYIEAKQEQ